MLLNKSDSALESFLIKRGFSVKRLLYRSRRDRISCFIKLFWHFLFRRPDIVHVHLVEAGLTAIPAAYLAFINKRVYTRHHSTYHHLYHPSFVKVDKWINRLSTHLIAISGNVRDVLIEKEHVFPSKITVIHHGFDLILFKNDGPDVQLKVKYNPSSKLPVIGVISRYQHLKGYQYIIPAFKKLLIDYPDALLIIANARGEYAKEIKSMLSELPRNSFVEINFEDNISALYSLFDVFVHVPIDKNCEAFGQIYIEALAASVPSVFTLSGIASDFVKDRENALVVPYCDANAIYKAITTVLSSKEIANSIAQKGRSDVFDNFGLDKMIKAHIRLYES